MATKPNAKGERIQIRLTGDALERVRRAAEAEGVTQTEWVRDAVEARLDAEPGGAVAEVRIAVAEEVARVMDERLGAARAPETPPRGS